MTTDHGRRYAYNLIAKQYENLDDMVIGTTLVHHVPISVLFDFVASYYFIFFAFVTQHNIFGKNININLNIGMENKNVFPSKLYRL